MKVAKNFKLDDTTVLFPCGIVDGLVTVDARAIKGSRLVVSFYSKSLSGSQVTLRIKNSFSCEIPFRTLEEVSLTAANSFEDITVVDFHEFFQFELESLGGPAEVAIGVSTYDGATVTTSSTDAGGGTNNPDGGCGMQLETQVRNIPTGTTSYSSTKLNLINDITFYDEQMNQIELSYKIVGQNYEVCSTADISNVTIRIEGV